MAETIYTKQAPEPIGPYSQAKKVGNTLYCSGQIAINPETQKVLTGDIQVETRMVLENLGAVLRAGGMDFRDVVKCTIYLADLAQFSQVNEIYGQYFMDSQPARETVQVARLPKNVNIEISAIAVKE